MAHSLTTCTFCGVGCGLYLETSSNRVTGVYPSMSHPANKGKICIRGWHVHEVASSPDRLKTPLLKKNGQLVESSWAEALEFIASRLKEIKGTHGPDSIALLSSPRCSNEESYLLQKLARSVIGTNNVDHGAGVYTNNSVGVLLEMLGVAASTSSIEDLDKSEVIIVDGVDLNRQLPTIAGTVLRAKLSGAKLVVIGERRQRVAENAEWFLQINPGTETLLYGAMAKVIVDHGLVNLGFIKAHCADYEAFLAQVRGYDLQGVCDMGMLPDLLPGYRPVADTKGRTELETVWGTKLPTTPGVSAASVLKDRAQGKIKAVWFDRYDPVNTAAVGTAAKAISECELVIVQHLFLTETAKLADVVLPTTAFAEEQVSFTSTERRIQLAQQAIEPPAGITPAWQQILEIARALGADWKYESSAQVMDEIGRAIPAYSAAGYENLSVEFGRQWPCTKDSPHGTAQLFADGTGASFKFASIPKPAAPVALDKDFPFTLVLGNSSYYWNQNVLIAHSETLKREYRVMLLDYPKGFVEINAEDARNRKIRDKQRIKLCSAGGSTVTVARVTPEVRSGTVFVPYQELGQMEQIRGTQGDGPRYLAVRVETEVA